MKIPFFDACPCKSMYKNILLCSLLIRLGSLQKSELILRLVVMVAAAAAAAVEAAVAAVDEFLRNVDRFALRVDRQPDVGVIGIESISFFDTFRLIRVIVVLFPVFNFVPCDIIDSFFLPLRALATMVVFVYRLLLSEQKSRLLCEF